MLDEAYTLLPSPSVRQEQAAHSSFIASSILMQCLISIVVCHVDSNDGFHATGGGELAKEASRMLNRNAAVNLKLKVWVILVESASTQAM